MGKENDQAQILQGWNIFGVQQTKPGNLGQIFKVINEIISWI